MIGLLGSFAGLMAAGVPLAFVITASALVYIWFATSVPLTTVAQQLFVGVDDFTLTAIPLFIVAGYLMNEAGLTRRLVVLARLLLRKVYAGLAQAAVLVSMVFGGVTGAAAADLAAVGTVLIPEMEEDGYGREFSTSTILAASLMGAVIPPSIPFVIYGVQSETSIGQLFLAGLIPGIAIGLTIMITNVIVLKRKRFTPAPPGARAGEDPKTLALAFRDAILALMMPVVILGGILGGVFTATEAAGVAAGYAFLVGALVFRSLSWRRLPHVFLQSTRTTAIVMIIVAASAVLNWCLAYSQLPAELAEALVSVSESPAVFLAFVLVVLVIVGMPLDPVPGLIIMTPVLLPAAQTYEIDPVHFGVVMVMALTLGLVTPPIGASLFVASAISRVSIERLSITVLPFLAALFLLTILVTFVPDTYLWLVELVARN